MSIEYVVSIVEADAHLIDVQLVITNPDPSGQRLELPNWIPGSYMIRDFSRNLVSIKAWSDSVRVDLVKHDKSTWIAPAGLSDLTIAYRIYAWDLSVRSAHVDRHHAFFNGTSVFLKVKDQEMLTHQVCFERPRHDTANNFKLATTLDEVDVGAGGYGVYRASDYDELIDHPVEQGDFKRLSFEACAVPHEIVFTGACYFDEERVVEDLTRICEHQIRFFGEPAPFERYLFLTMVVDRGYGGLEHRSSTALMVTRENLPVPGDEALSDQYLEFLGLCSHEYFHNWNVKRMKPARFMPYELASESYTRLLWFFEGITSYYDDLFLVRSGLIDETRYLGLLAKTLTRVQRGPGRLLQSISDSSFDAWHKFYKQDENAPNAIVSYYAKGALVALCLDSIMRQSSSGAVTLDTLMHTLWARWLETGKGLEEDEPPRVVEELLEEDVSSFFEQALHGTQDLPVVTALEHLGVTLKWCERRSVKDVGGVRQASDSGESLPNIPWIGTLFKSAPGGVQVTHVISESPAEAAGLAAGDLLVAINALSVNVDSLESLTRRFAQTDAMQVHYFRLGQLYESTVPVRSAPEDTALLEIADEELMSLWLKNGAGSNTDCSNEQVELET
ncbi:MAG: PDZ domain-containing protein [Granulosicoccus sp.]|nr:PDZ domain-containing protein [Granulosicoccus sp.]